MNMQQLLSAFDSKSLAYGAIYEALGGFRGTTTAPAATAAAMVGESEKAQIKHKVDGIADFVKGLPVVIAGKGAVALAEIAAGTVDLGTAGDSGFVFSLIGVRGIVARGEDGKEEKRNGAIGLALYPAHSLDAFLATEEGRAWVQSQVDKEAGLVAFRNLRMTPGEATLADLSQAAFTMPCLVSDFTDRTRASTAESFASFKTYWPVMVARLAANAATAKLVEALPTRRDDILSAFRSANYAATLFPELEKAGHFVRMAQIFGQLLQSIAANKEESGETVDFDPLAPARWIEGRDNLDLLPKAAKGVDLSEIDFGAFTF